MVLIVILITIFVLGFGFIAYLMYRRVLRKAKNIERGLKMVPLLIHLPPPSEDTEANGRNISDVMREKISQGEVLYNLISGTASAGFKSNFYGQRHIALEIIATDGLIHFYVAVPVALEGVIQNAIVTAYPGATVEEAEDHNIFNPMGKLGGTTGGELVLKADSAYPIAAVEQLESDPIAGILNALGDLQEGDGVGIQIMLRPANPGWVKHSLHIVKHKRRNAGEKSAIGYSTRDLIMAPVKSPQQRREEVASASPQALYMSELETSVVKAVEDKTRLTGYEVLIRVLVSSTSSERSRSILSQITTSFSLFDAPGLNGFKFLPASDIAGLVTAFILRFFPPELNQNILNSAEMATLFHLPDAQFTAISDVQRQTSKQIDGPVTLSSTGLLLGYNFFRGTKKEIRLSPDDRRRHTYIVGQTGTGKSTLMENLAVQDMLAGNGFALIDPHGDVAERLLSMVPKNRAEDIIYFNPSDTEYPLGLNLFEFQTPDQKDFLIQEAIGMLYKLYDPGHTGIIGPRYEHWFRNAALTLMADPAGATFIEIPKVFTDTDYLKRKFKYLTDPTVIDFWTQEMAQTSDYHKSEMLGWFVSKFGAFQSNEIMRNIIGQPKSAFNLRDIMDNKKILIVNLSKGKIGELNSQLLGMIFVIKFQAAAMSRANLDEASRADFCLYVDEFQNFATDSFASILSEARKYRLNLVVANQFIGQLSDQIRDAVFGNVGTVMSYRTGPEDAEFLVKQFAPAFDARDLVNIPNHNAVIRLMNGGLPSQPFSITALPPLGVASPELGAAVKQLSAAKFGVNRAQVEQEIFARLSGKAPLPPPTASTLPASAPVMPVAAAAVAATSPPPLPTPTNQAEANSVLPLPPLPEPTPAPIEPAIARSTPSNTQTAPVPPLPESTQVSVGSSVDSSMSLPLPQPQPAISSLPLPVPPVTQGAAALEPEPAAATSVVLPFKLSETGDEQVRFQVPVDPAQQLAKYATDFDQNFVEPKPFIPQEPVLASYTPQSIADERDQSDQGQAPLPHRATSLPPSVVPQKEASIQVPAKPKPVLLPESANLPPAEPSIKPVVPTPVLPDAPPSFTPDQVPKQASLSQVGAQLQPKPMATSKIPEPPRQQTATAPIPQPNQPSPSVSPEPTEPPKLPQPPSSPPVKPGNELRPVVAQGPSQAYQPEQRSVIRPGNTPSKKRLDASSSDRQSPSSASILPAPPTGLEKSTPPIMVHTSFNKPQSTTQLETPLKSVLPATTVEVNPEPIDPNDENEAEAAELLSSYPKVSSSSEVPSLASAMAAVQTVPANFESQETAGEIYVDEHGNVVQR